MIEADTPRRLVPDSAIDVIFVEVSNGATLLDACERAGIGRTSVYRWLDADPTLAERYAQAVAAQTRARYLKQQA